ncbi:LLM class flavin-dependent oxidoreductase, partial [Amycolatopsis acidicola]
MEMWLLSKVFARDIAGYAADAERAGWDGLMFPDSQNVIGDVFVHLGIAAAVTSRIKLGTGVTNPYTRHPSVVASAAVDLQQVTG